MTGRGSTALRTTAAYAALVTAAVFWGGNAIASKILYQTPDAHFDAPTLVIARAAWSLPIFLLMAFAARPKRPIPLADRRTLLALGIAFGPGAVGYLALAAQYTSGAHVTLLLSLVAPVTAGLAAMMLRERPDALRIVALAIGIAGTALLTLTRSASGSTVFGDVLELVQVIGYASSLVLTRMLGQRYSAIFVTGTYGSIGMGMLVLAGAVTGRLPFAIGQTLVPSAAVTWWFFGQMILGLTIYGQTAQAFALRYLDAGITSLLGSYFTLVFGILGSLFLLHETIAPTGVLAGLLLALALALALVPTGSRSSTDLVTLERAVERDGARAAENRGHL